MQKFGKTHIYSFDLGNYKSQIMNPNAKNLTLLTTLNETVFKMLEFLEKGGKSLVDYINETYQVSLPFLRKPFPFYRRGLFCY